MHFSSLALAFAYLDRLIRSPGRDKMHWLTATRDILTSAGFDDCVYGEPYEILEGLVQLPFASQSSRDELWLNFMDATSTCMV